MWRGWTAGTLRASRRPTDWETGDSSMGCTAVNRLQAPEVGLCSALLGAGAVRAPVDDVAPAPRPDEQTDAVQPPRRAGQADADGRAAAAEALFPPAVDDDRHPPYARPLDAAQV